MTNHTLSAASAASSRRALPAALVAVLVAASGTLAACDFRDDACQDELVGARFVVTPSQDGRVVATASVNGEDAGATTGAELDAAPDAEARDGEGAPVTDASGPTSGDGAADASAARDAGAASGSVFGDDLSCAEICRLGFGTQIDLVACRGPFRGEAASTPTQDGGAATRIPVTFADCEGVATVCRGPEYRAGGRHRSHAYD